MVGLVEIGKKGIVGLQVWLLVFGIVGFVFMMGMVSGASRPIVPSSAQTPVRPPSPSQAAAEMEEIVKDKGLNKNLDKILEEQKKEKKTTVVAGTNKDSWLSEFLGTDPGSGYSALATGLQWAFSAYLTGLMLGNMFGMSEDNSKAVATSLGAGFGTYKGLATYLAGDGKNLEIFAKGGKLNWVSQHPGWVGAGVGVLIFVMMYKETDTKVVTFNCHTWQAPSGGNDCERCNEDDLPCSEYRCKSLGQSCEIVNEGTENEKCVYVNPKDVSPPIIKPDYDELTPGHDYKNVKTSPPGPGFEIVNLNSNDGCLKAFTPLEFGIVTDEPAQCKIDYNSTDNFEDMAAYFGGSNLYLYNHSETFSLPGASELSGAGLVLTNGKDFSFYVRCQDKNGNVNEAEYAVNFCVDPSPDTTAAKIEATSIASGGCVAEDIDEADVVFYLNEPATCRWSFQDQDYDIMEHDMKCSSKYVQSNGAQLFPCEGTLTGIPRDGTDYYIRCKDQPGKEESDRNENAESFEFSLRGSTGLTMKNLRPNESVFGGVSPAPIELYAETYYGCDNGLAVCAWSSDGTSYVEFYDTYNEDSIHTQRLDLTEGNYEYYVKCVDNGGNVAEDSVKFNVEIDENAPVIARVYEEGGMLKIVTVRESECSYSLDDCDFTFSEGTEMPYGNTTVHVTDWNEEDTYYIKCRDEFLNEEADCSLIVKPTANFL